MRKLIGVLVLAGALHRSDAPRAVFAPDGGVARALIAEIASARRSVRVAMYAFSRTELADALIAAHRRGTDVQVKLDRELATKPNNPWRALRDAGVRVSFSDGPGHLHHKFMVVDERTVVNGSYNWLNRAETLNHENVVIWKDARLAGAFLSEWQRIPASEVAP